MPAWSGVRGGTMSEPRRTCHKPANRDGERPLELKPMTGARALSVLVA